MPRQPRLPRLCRHKATGLAYATDPDLRRPVYFGKHGSAEADQKYRAWAAAFLARRKEAPVPAPAGLTVGQLVEAYLAHAEVEYARPGRRVTEHRTIGQALGPAVELFGLAPAGAFGPDELRAVRARYVEKGWSRQHVNRQVGRLRGCWRWGVSRKAVPGAVLVELESVEALRFGRAREGRPVQLVPVGEVERTLPHLAERWQRLVRIHLWNAMRPGEAVIMRPCDITQDESSTLWVYRPSYHKTEGWGHKRVIYLGARSQEELRPLLEGTAPDGWLFANAKVPGAHVSVGGYHAAVKRACEKAGTAWVPGQLRHTALTAVRAKYGLEGAQVRAGHRHAKTSEIYARAGDELARKIAEETG